MDTIDATCWIKLTPEMYSPSNVHAIFLYSDRGKFGTRLLCAVAKTSPVVFYSFFA